MAKTPKSDFIFKRHMSIGDVDAENDKNFLKEGFVDNGDYDVLIDTSTPQAIVLGRTGAGKSALIEQVDLSQRNTIRIEPEELALKHISNSNILQFFEQLGVNLDVFYNLLWQHTFAVELIQYKYRIETPEESKGILDRIANIISGDKKKQEALDYLEQWGEKFWVSTELRIKELTEKLEQSLKAGFGSKGIPFNFSGASKLTEEQKSELVHYGKKVVNDTQIQKLSRIINLLAEDIFDDPQNKTFILIDKLDENWVDDELRYKLIRALIETIKKFRKIENVKIIVTLRTDLLERVIQFTRDSGFQLEKYRSLFLYLEWNREQLKSLIDKRLNILLKHKYTNSEVYFDDVFPAKVDKTNSIDYILDRTLLRPRDAIMYINTCIEEAQGKSEIEGSTIKNAEKRYSAERKESLEYEWYVEHPHLNKYLEILNGRKKSFKLPEIEDSIFELMILELQDSQGEYLDDVVRTAKNYMQAEYPQTISYMNLFRQNLIYCLFKVGSVGIKVNGRSSVTWARNKDHNISPAKIENSSIIYINKMLWRTLAVDVR